MSPTKHRIQLRGIEPTDDARLRFREPRLDFCQRSCFWAWVQAQQSPEPVALDTLED